MNRYPQYFLPILLQLFLLPFSPSGRSLLNFQFTLDPPDWTLSRVIFFLLSFFLRVYPHPIILIKLTILTFRVFLISFTVVYNIYSNSIETWKILNQRTSLSMNQSAVFSQTFTHILTVLITLSLTILLDYENPLRVSTLNSLGDKWIYWHPIENWRMPYDILLFFPHLFGLSCTSYTYQLGIMVSRRILLLKTFLT